ncbi:hypothetical protein JY651_03060 [Pyxidicoccus parkwayensis]|uniref:Outer membrane protein beta-barrel domain-containing protein n=1 Tax=Pyxidicoccus parkwayensis TaxID=2813578 RepID=A0ABX7NZY0_9BACT|nr:hypothetical protein [Pyxidicoccus parkwaysis]QSQ23976.1 hypothetical protein JY651_03060 [Pyxidicoccus parkwaysis]
MKTARVTSALLFALLTLSTLAHAGENRPSGSPGSVLDTPAYGHRLDLGGSVGLNNAGGMGYFTGFGLVADLRLVDFLSVGAGVGGGMWGPRLTSHARVYPLGISRAVFLQGALAYNVGTRSWLDEMVDVNEHVIRSDVTTANASLGYRKDLGSRGWLTFEAGWAFRLNAARYRPTGSHEFTQSEKEELRFARPGGLVLGISGGFSVL